MNNQSKNLFKGTFFGLLIHFIGLSIFYFSKFTDYSLAEYVTTLRQKSLMAPIISISLVPNILLFFFFVNRNRLKEGQGVIFSMLLWGIAIVYYKFFA